KNAFGPKPEAHILDRIGKIFNDYEIKRREDLVSKPFMTEFLNQLLRRQCFVSHAVSCRYFSQNRERYNI
ncbi:MAG: hypothetical protein ABJQ14_19365, partial [Hyphomicrobiales bacterium]